MRIQTIQIGIVNAYEYSRSNSIDAYVVDRQLIVPRGGMEAVSRAIPCNHLVSWVFRPATLDSDDVFETPHQFYTNRVHTLIACFRVQVVPSFGGGRYLSCIRGVTLINA